MFEDIVVLIIVLLATFFVGRKIYKNLSSENITCGCGLEEDCPSCSISNTNKGTCCGTGQDSISG